MSPKECVCHVVFPRHGEDNSVRDLRHSLELFIDEKHVGGLTICQEHREGWELLVATSAHLVDGLAHIVQQFIMFLLEEDEVEGFETMEQEKNNGLGVCDGAPNYDMRDVLDLAKKALQAKTRTNDLFIMDVSLFSPT